MLTPRRHLYLARAVLVVTVLLATVGALAAQPLLPRDHNGHVVYKGQAELPGLTQAEVLARAVRFADQHLMLEGGVQYYTLLVDSAAHLMSSKAYYPAQLPLHYELVVRARAGGYTYEVSDVATEVSTTASPLAPGVSLLHPARRYEPVETVLDKRSNYDSLHRPRPALQAYCATVAREVQAALALLRAEMARP